MKMKFLSAALVGVLITLIAVSCGRSEGVFDTKLSALGTFADISVAGLPDAQAQLATDAVEMDLRELDQVGYTFAANGELHDLNEALAEGRSMQVSASLLGLIEIAKELYLASDGLFNPAFGELTALWEFHCDKSDCADSPYPEEVLRLVQEKEADVIAKRPSMDDLVLDGATVSSSNTAVKLEFGDMIRGYALDKGIDHLREMGIKNAMLNLGGSVRGIGSRNNHPWWDSVLDESGVHGVGYIELNESEAVVTVRAYDRSIGKDDFVYRHVVDSRTGLPVENIKAVTVIHDSAVWANAAATALLVNGIDGWAEIAKKMGVRSVMMIMKDGTMYTSSTMEERVHWRERTRHQHLVP